MTERYVVLVRVESIRGKCMRGHFVGEEWKITHKTPEGICMGAFGSLLPAIRTLQFGGTFPWQKGQNFTKIGCIDSVNTVAFRVERLDEICPP